MSEIIKNKVGEMQKRREMMADGRRYLIYYTFEIGKTDNNLSETDESAIEKESAEDGENV